VAWNQLIVPNFWEIFLLSFTSATAALEAEILSNNPTIAIIETDVM